MLDILWIKVLGLSAVAEGKAEVRYFKRLRMGARLTDALEG
jgi:hypothetical protein